jgi:hypothetical protein
MTLAEKPVRHSAASIKDDAPFNWEDPLMTARFYPGLGGGLPAARRQRGQSAGIGMTCGASPIPLGVDRHEA